MCKRTSEVVIHGVLSLESRWHRPCIEGNEEMSYEYGLPSHIKQVDAPFSSYEMFAEDCDIALHTPTSYFGRAIARHTGGPGWNFSHVEAVIRWNKVDTLMSCGYQEGLGGVARPLLKEVRKKSGHIHIFRVKQEFFDKMDRWTGNTQECVMQRLGQDLGDSYSWHGIILQLMNLLPLTRWLVPTRKYESMVAGASAKMGSGYCSQHIARSFGSCGIRFSKKNYALMSPNDLAQSPICSYVCTLGKD
jgi:hypothetical protein